MRKLIYPILALICVAALVWVQTQQEKELKELPAPQTRDTTVEAEISPWLTVNDFLPKSEGEIVHHYTYSLAYNEDHEQAQWTAHVLKSRDINSNDFERPYFEVDPNVSTGAAHWKNYKKSGYDRGHLVPAGDRKASKQAYEETFLTSNISPQKHEFNAGIWNSLEQKVRGYALEYGDLYVVTGPVLRDNLKTIGTERVSVPKYFFKIIYQDTRNGGAMTGWLIPADTSSTDPNGFIVPVDKIEQITAIDFFPQLDDAVEDRLESEKGMSR
ncbi:MAG: DNA/RNA non-specific endonuclease [Nonlabens sp.]